MPIVPKSHDSGNRSYQQDAEVVVVLPGTAPPLAGASWHTVTEAYLSAAVDSDNTRRAYRRHLRDAGHFFANVPVNSLNGADLARYRGRVASSGLAPASQGQALAAVRSFLGWAGMVGAHQLPLEVIRTALRTPRATTLQRYNIVTEPEIASLLATTVAVRERALLGVLLGAGLRVAEVSGLDVSDIVEDQDGETALFVRSGKGRRDRVVPVRPEVDRLLRQYLGATGRYLGEAGPLFVAHDRGAAKRAGKRLSARTMRELVRERADAAGIAAKRVSPHALRHTFAMRALRHGGNVVAVSKLLGHSSIATTQLYVSSLANSELRAAIPKLPIEPAA
jgi:integrase/recombinase XerC